jgi:hypothetical protein
MKRQTPGTIDLLSNEIIRALSETERALIKQAAEAHPAEVRISSDVRAQVNHLIEQGILIGGANELTATELGLKVGAMLQ